jgi:hypothetical protein
MAARELCLSNPLCFLFSNLNKPDRSTLKRAVLDFYSADELAKAKQQLVSDIDTLNLPRKAPRAPPRRGDDRAIHDVDDLFALIAFVDENRLLNNLPIYVSDNVNCMPSVRLFEGDLRSIMIFLEKMDMRVSDLGAAFAAISGEFRDLKGQLIAGVQSGRTGAPPATQYHPMPVSMPVGQTRQGPPRPPAPPPPPVRPSMPVRMESVVRGAAVGQPIMNEVPGPSRDNPVHTSATTNTTTPLINAPAPTAALGLRQPFPGRSWSTVAATSTPTPASVPVFNRYAPLLSTDDEAISSEDQTPFTQLVSRRSLRKSRKRDREPSSQQYIERDGQSVTDQTKRGRARMYGKSIFNQGKVSAARKIYKRAVFCVDNLGPDCTVDDVAKFVAGLGVTVLSCHSTKPRRRRTSFNRRDGVPPESDRTAFRLCIDAEDEDRLLNPLCWPDSVIISDWYFKPRQPTAEDTATGKRQRVFSPESAAAAVAAEQLPSQDPTVAAATADIRHDSQTADDTSEMNVSESGNETVISVADHDGAPKQC